MRVIRGNLFNALHIFAAASVLLIAAPAQAQIVLYVTGMPITAYDIEQRGRLITLSTGKTKSRQEVIDELIDDKLKILAGKRYNLDISDADVESTFANLARGAGVSSEQFGKNS